MSVTAFQRKCYLCKIQDSLVASVDYISIEESLPSLMTMILSITPFTMKSILLDNVPILFLQLHWVFIDTGNCTFFRGYSGEFCVDLKEAGVILKERTSIEKIPSPDWPMEKSVMNFLDSGLIWTCPDHSELAFLLCNGKLNKPWRSS